MSKYSLEGVSKKTQSMEFTIHLRGLVGTSWFTLLTMVRTSCIGKPDSTGGQFTHVPSPRRRGLPKARAPFFLTAVYRTIHGQAEMHGWRERIVGNWLSTGTSVNIVPASSLLGFGCHAPQVAADEDNLYGALHCLRSDLDGRSRWTGRGLTQRKLQKR